MAERLEGMYRDLDAGIVKLRGLRSALGDSANPERRDLLDGTIADAPCRLEHAQAQLTEHKRELAELRPWIPNAGVRARLP